VAVQRALPSKGTYTADDSYAESVSEDEEDERLRLLASPHTVTEYAQEDAALETSVALEASHIASASAARAMAMVEASAEAEAFVQEAEDAALAAWVDANADAQVLTSRTFMFPCQDTVL